MMSKTVSWTGSGGASREVDHDEAKNDPGRSKTFKAADGSPEEDCEEWAKGVGGGGSGIGEEGAELFTDNKSVLNLQDDVQGSKGAEAKIGLLQGGIIFFKSCFGCGILGMPFAFRNAGVMAGLISCVVIAVVVNVATKMLVWVKRDLLKTRGVTVTSIPEMAGVLLGRSGQNCANALVIACQFGVCIAYNIFIGVSLTAIVEELVPAGNLHGKWGYDPYVFFVVCQVLLFSLMVQMRELASLAPLLIFAQLAIVVALTIIVCNGLVNPSVCDRDGNEKIFCKVHTGFRADKYAIFIGIAVFAMEGIPTILAIEHSLAEPERFEEMFDRAQALLALVFLVFGSLCYWLYGNNTRSVVSLNVPGTQGLVVKMLMVIVIFCSYPLQFVPVSQVAQLVMQGKRGQLAISRVWERLPAWVVTYAILGRNQREFSMRVWGAMKIAGVVITGVVACLVPHFGHVLSIMGCCTFSIITFVLPPVMFLKSQQGQHQFQKVIICCLLVLFGACVTVFGLYGNFVSNTVYKSSIEKAPPRAGSAEARQERDIFKTAAGEMKHKDVKAAAVEIKAATHLTKDFWSKQLNKDMWNKQRELNPTGWANPRARNSVRERSRPGAPRSRTPTAPAASGANSMNVKQKFYHEAEEVAKMEGMVKNTASWHAIVPKHRSTSPPAAGAIAGGEGIKTAAVKRILHDAAVKILHDDNAIKAATVKKILELKLRRSRMSKPGHPLSNDRWAAVDSTYVTTSSAAPPPPASIPTSRDRGLAPVAAALQPPRARAYPTAPTSKASSEASKASSRASNGYEAAAPAAYTSPTEASVTRARRGGGSRSGGAAGREKGEVVKNKDLVVERGVAAAVAEETGQQAVPAAEAVVVAHAEAFAHAEPHAEAFPHAEVVPHAEAFADTDAEAADLVQHPQEAAASSLPIARARTAEADAAAGGGLGSSSGSSSGRRVAEAGGAGLPAVVARAVAAALAPTVAAAWAKTSPPTSERQVEADKATQSTAEEAAAESIHSSIETHQAHLAHKAARTRLHTHAQTLTDASTDWTKAREKLRPSVPLDVPKTLGARTTGEETAAAVREHILSAAAPLPVTWHSSPKDLVSWADGKEVGGTGATRGSSQTQTSAYVPQEQEQEEEHEYDSRPDAPPHAPTHALETAAQRLALWAEGRGSVHIRGAGDAAKTQPTQSVYAQGA